MEFAHSLGKFSEKNIAVLSEIHHHGARLVVEDLFIVKIQAGLCLQHLVYHLLQRPVADAMHDFKFLQPVFAAEIDGLQQFLFLDKKPFKRFEIKRVLHQFFKMKIENQRVFVVFFRNFAAFFRFFDDFNIPK